MLLALGYNFFWKNFVLPGYYELHERPRPILRTHAIGYNHQYR